MSSFEQIRQLSLAKGLLPMLPNLVEKRNRRTSRPRSPQVLLYIWHKSETFLLYNKRICLPYNDNQKQSAAIYTAIFSFAKLPSFLRQYQKPSLKCTILQKYLPIQGHQFLQLLLILVCCLSIQGIK